MIRLWKTLVLGTCLVTAGCGVTYTSPTVKSQSAGAEVRVVDLDAQTVLVANREPYTPRALPVAFFQQAGGGQLRGAGALPEAPYVPNETRKPLELRIPPTPPVEAYRIGVSDVLLLATKSGGTTIEELSGLLTAQNKRQGYTVRDDGSISIPDLGQVMVAGLTLEEAEARVFQALVENGIDPAFSLEVAEFNSKRVVVGGAVGSAKILPLTLNPIDLSEALTASGGVQVKNEDFASVRIYRDGTLYQIPLETFFARPDLQKLKLQDGDAVYVDTNYDLDQALAFYNSQVEVIQMRRQARSNALAELQAEISIRSNALNEQRSNFRSRLDLGAEKRDYVYLAGEVSNQSRVALPFGQQATLADVLYEKGGFNVTTGDPSDIYVLRPSSNPAEFGAVTAWHLDAGNAINLTLATRFEMRPNDIIFIEEQPITSWNRAMQQFFPVLINTAQRAALQQ